MGRLCFMLLVLTRLFMSIIFLDHKGEVLGLPWRVSLSSLDRTLVKKLGIRLKRCWMSLAGSLSGPGAERGFNIFTALEKSARLRSSERRCEVSSDRVGKVIPNLEHNKSRLWTKSGSRLGPRSELDLGWVLKSRLSWGSGSEVPVPCGETGGWVGGDWINLEISRSWPILILFRINPP